MFYIPLDSMVARIRGILARDSQHNIILLLKINQPKELLHIKKVMSAFCYNSFSMKVLVAVAVFLVIELVTGEQKCHKDNHGIRRFNGKPCASTTRCNDGHRGACGCGPSNSDTPFNWNMADYVTAPNQMYFDNGGMSSWCGRNCGKCVKLTPTGGFVPGKGNHPNNRNSIIFMVTNDCPIGDNFEWCGQSGRPGTNHPNTHGYEAHFDLQNNRNQILGGLGWDNPEVTWEEVACPYSYGTKYSQCEC